MFTVTRAITKRPDSQNSLAGRESGRGEQRLSRFWIATKPALIQKRISSARSLPLFCHSRTSMCAGDLAMIEYRPGQIVPYSGIYTVIHDKNHNQAHEVTCVYGEPFPPYHCCS